MIKSPCYTCLRHSAICHAQCVEYHDWVAQLKKDRAAKLAVRDADIHISVNAERIRRRRNLR